MRLRSSVGCSEIVGEVEAEGARPIIGVGAEAEGAEIDARHPVVMVKQVGDKKFIYRSFFVHIWVVKWLCGCDPLKSHR